MKVDIQALAKERKEAIAAGQAICEAAKTASEDLTDEQLAEVQAHVAKAEELKTAIEAAEKKAIAQAAMFTALDSAGDWDATPQPRITAPVNPTPVSNPVITGGRDAEKFESFGHQLIAVRHAASQHPDQWDPRLTGPQSAISGANETIGSEGGFLVGTDSSDVLLQRMYANNQILNGSGYANPERVPISANSNSVKFKALDETSRANGSRFGGVEASWIEEGGDKPDTKPKFRTMELSLKKLVGLYYATDELLQDASALEALVLNWFGQEFAFKVQDALINGTGAGMPQGILPANCLVNQAKETGQVAATIVKKNIDKMWSRMWASGIGSSVWHINQQCYPALFDMEQSVGTGGLPAFLPPGGLSVSPYGTLMGRPIVPLEQCQALGTKGDIFFCDW